MDSDAHPERSHDWHAAAERASFTPFEAHGGSTTRRWAGGYGGSPFGTTHLEVMSQIDGVELSVTTADPARLGGRPTRQLLVHDLLGRFTLEQEDLVLPLTLIVVHDDREFAIDGDPVMFDGVRLEGEARWLGHADLNGVSVTVSAAGPVDFSIRGCLDGTGLSVLPPD